MKWVYLSPHYDDAAYSCGGVIWTQTQLQQVEVEIWTICAGEPPLEGLPAFAQELHARWQTGEQAVKLRRAEDERAAAILGARAVRFGVFDCIYRRDRASGAALYDTEESLWGPLHPAEDRLVDEIAAQMRQRLQPGARVQVAAPLGLGRHVDHKLARAAAEQLGLPLLYYADYPYAARSPHELEQVQREGWKPVRQAVPEAGLRAWEAAIEAYSSQISTFWSGPEELRASLRRYVAALGGVFLWEKGSFS